MLGPFLTTHGTILSPCPLWRSISTVDRFFLVWGHIDGRYRPIFFGMNPYRRSISTDFLVKSTVDQISTVFSSRWILINRWYRPNSRQHVWNLWLAQDLNVYKTHGLWQQSDCHNTKQCSGFFLFLPRQTNKYPGALHTQVKIFSRQ